MENDYSLLRPFDLEAAKRGEAILWGSYTYAPCEFLGESSNKPNRPDLGAHYRIEHEGGLSYVSACDLRMAPLCWVEWNPVYKNADLWQKTSEGWRKVTAERVAECGKYLYFFNAGSWAIDGSMSKLTWTPPPVKREGWVNIYPEKPGAVWGGIVGHSGFSALYDSKEAADYVAGGDRVACVRIEWEEPSAP